MARTLTSLLLSYSRLLLSLTPHFTHPHFTQGLEIRRDYEAEAKSVREEKQKKVEELQAALAQKQQNEKDLQGRLMPYYPRPPHCLSPRSAAWLTDARVRRVPRGVWCGESDLAQVDALEAKAKAAEELLAQYKPKETLPGQEQAEDQSAGEEDDEEGLDDDDDSNEEEDDDGEEDEDEAAAAEKKETQEEAKVLLERTDDVKEALEQAEKDIAGTHRHSFAFLFLCFSLSLSLSTARGVCVQPPESDVIHG